MYNFLIDVVQTILDFIRSSEFRYQLFKIYLNYELKFLLIFKCCLIQIRLFLYTDICKSPADNTKNDKIYDLC